VAASDAGPAPVVSQYVLKVHSRCDLACDHCYVYERADQSWRRRPRFMAPATATAAARRIAEHAATHRLPAVSVVVHGGEPLLLGAAGLHDILALLRREVDPVTRLDLRLQSNGVRLSQAICDVLREHRVSIGISLDGDRVANDRHRRFMTGATSHPQVVRALQLLREKHNRVVYGGLLCTIDLANDPIVVYEALLAEAPPRIDFLLPHATWDEPPARPDGSATPYADWLMTIHRRWIADGRPVPIRMFDSLRSMAAGGPSGTEAFGLDPVDLIVIETDGAWEQADSLKTAFDGAPATGLTVFEHSADRAAAHPQLARRRAGLAALCADCRSCHAVRQCGGGLFAHRYRSGHGFDNPSVYCADLKELVMSTADPAPLSQQLLDEIATGHVATETMHTLDARAEDMVEALLAEIADRSADGEARHAWDVLVALSGSAPGPVRAVLAHPYVRLWAIDCLLGRGRARPDYLGNVAAAAAVRAGVAAEVPVAVIDGAVHLPTIGSAMTGGTADGSARIGADGTVTLDGAPPLRPLTAVASGAWLPARTVPVLGPAGRPVPLEDLDPHRDGHEWPVAARLSDPAAARWADVLGTAWTVVERHAPGHAPALRTGLRAVTALRVGPAGRQLSSAVRHAYGAVGLSLGPPDEVAVLLVHEFQHVVLGAVLDSADLFAPADHSLLHVGWRPDPRPVEAVLQGAYAHLAITEMYGGWRPERYRRYRDWTADAIAQLLGSDALTATGRRFVECMDAALSGPAA